MFVVVSGGSLNWRSGKNLRWLRGMRPTLEADFFRWKLEPSGQFLTKSLYKALHQGAAQFQPWTYGRLSCPSKLRYSCSSSSMIDYHPGWKFRSGMDQGMVYARFVEIWKT